MGSVYMRGKVYWIKYYRHGKPYRESSKSDMITKAQKLLRTREGEIAAGKLPGICFDKVTFDELAGDFLTDYRINGKRTPDKATCCVEHLKEIFEGTKATDITTAKVKEYIDRRMKQGISNASINRELAAHLDAQRSLRAPEFDCVVYQIDEHLVDTASVGADGGQRLLHHKLRPRLL